MKKVILLTEYYIKLYIYMRMMFNKLLKRFFHYITQSLALVLKNLELANSNNII